MQIKNDNGERLSNDISETKSSDRVKSRSRLEQIVMIVLIVIFILVNLQYILIVRRNYNHRFDAGAQVSGSFELTFSFKAQRQKAGTFTASAGQVTYRFSQKEGETPTEYLLKYKRVGDSGDCIPLRTITVTTNGEYIGYFELASSDYCQRYSLYCERLDDGNGASTIEIDWGVNFDC